MTAWTYSHRNSSWLTSIPAIRLGSFLAGPYEVSAHIDLSTVRSCLIDSAENAPAEAGAAAAEGARVRWPGCSFLHCEPKRQLPRWKNWQTTIKARVENRAIDRRSSAMPSGRGAAAEAVEPEPSW